MRLCNPPAREVEARLFDVLFQLESLSEIGRRNVAVFQNALTLLKVELSVCGLRFIGRRQPARPPVGGVKPRLEMVDGRPRARLAVGVPEADFPVKLFARLHAFGERHFYILRRFNLARIPHNGFRRHRRLARNNNPIGGLALPVARRQTPRKRRRFKRIAERVFEKFADSQIGRRARRENARHARRAGKRKCPRKDCIIFLHIDAFCTTKRGIPPPPVNLRSILPCAPNASTH